MPSIIDFPDTVDERAARTVAGGVVTLAATTAAADRLRLTAPLAYGFAARVATGPRLSSLGLLASRAVAPRLPEEARPAAGHTERLTQGMGLALSGAALVLGLVLGRRQAARAVLAVLVVAAGFEAFAGLCLACTLYPLLVRARLAPKAGHPECGDLSLRHRHGDR